MQIAKWIYQQTEKATEQVWVEETVLRHFGPSWAACFAARNYLAFSAPAKKAQRPPSPSKPQKTVCRATRESNGRVK